MPVSKSIAAETVMKFIQAGVGCILVYIWQYYITELLFYIAGVDINAEVSQ